MEDDDVERDVGGVGLGPLDAEAGTSEDPLAAEPGVPAAAGTAPGGGEVILPLELSRLNDGGLIAAGRPSRGFSLGESKVMVAFAVVGVNESLKVAESALRGGPGTVELLEDANDEGNRAEARRLALVMGPFDISV